MEMTAQQLCQMLNGELEGDPDIAVTGPSKIEDATEGTLSFLANPKYEHFVYQTKASVLLVNRDFKPEKPVAPTLIRVEDVYASMGKVLGAIGDDEILSTGISDLASIHDSAAIGEDASVGPFAVISAGVEIGRGARIYPHVYIGPYAKVGAGARLYPGVRIYHQCEIGDQCVIHANTVIGSDGFGFARSENGAFAKIAQIGNVVIEDQVEIGANTVIDRATIGSTLIRKGAKLDNLIQVAHNVEIGENSAMAAQSGIAGSSKLGRNVLVGGQAGFIGHIEVADNVQVQAQSGVAGSVKNKGEKLYGSPAMKYIDYLKSYSVFKNLPELQKKVNELEQFLEELKKKDS